MSDLNNYADRAISQFATTITGEVFLMIQNDPELMHDYLRLVEARGLDVVNRWIGRKVKERFNLDNEFPRQDARRSTLIRTFTPHD